MWNKNFRIIWFKLQTEKNPHFGFPFPIPLYIFTEILDCILDLLTFICLFASSSHIKPGSVSVYTLKNLAEMIIALLDSIVDGEPYDLADITAGHIRVSVKIR